MSTPFRNCVGIFEIHVNERFEFVLRRAGAVRGEHGNHMNQPSVAQLVALGHNFFHPAGHGNTIVWNYIGELVFNMLVLVGAIKMSDRLVRELMGLG